MSRLLLLALGVALLACTPSSAPTAPDASTSACANMARLGCAFGADPACPSRLELGVTTENRTTRDKVACAAAASSRAELAACGPYFRCSP